jgi:hypothetical protein
MDDDNGLRDAVRSFILNWQGEAINESIKKVKFEEGATINVLPSGPGAEGRIVHSKEELIEAIVDYHFKERGLAAYFKNFHEKHGRYPPLPDFSKMGRLVALNADEGEKGKDR